jgi:hypothetical protein
MEKELLHGGNIIKNVKFFKLMKISCLNFLKLTSSHLTHSFFILRKCNIRPCFTEIFMVIFYNI